MKKFLQLDPNYRATFSQKVASALRGLNADVFELSPEYTDNPQLRMFNRAKGSWLQTGSTAKLGQAGWNFQEKGAGHIAYNDGRDTHTYETPMSNGAWSLITVIQGASDGSTFKFFDPLGSSVVEGVLTFSLMLSTNRTLTVGEWSATTGAKRVTATDVDPTGTFLVAVTFNPESGLKMFVNGRLVDENKTDRRPLDVALARAPFYGTTGAGIGFIATVPVDLSLPQNEARLSSLQTALMDRFQITP